MTRRRRAAPVSASATHARGRAVVLAAVAFGLALGGGGFWALRGPTAHAPVTASRPNVLLVTIDTLRADHLGCYGATGAATPTLDALAARGVRFATAVAHAPLTTPSHASILTGLTPPRHGVRDNGDFALPDGIPTLAEAFGRGGYATAAFVSGFPLDRRFGLARGFRTYDDHLPHGDDPRRSAYVERTADRTTAAALRWLAGPHEPWFLWVHYFDPHSPYEPPNAFAERAPGRPYDGEIAFVDAELGGLLSALAARRDRTIVLVTADHGESLGEHGEETHGVFVYDATLRVPWIVAGPGVPVGGVAKTVARGIDVAPTLLDLAGLPSLAGAEGRTLRPALLGSPLPDAPSYAESLFARLRLGWAPLHAWRTSQWKLIDAPRPELYALDTDAAETHDRSTERPEVARALRQELDATLAAPARQASADTGPDAAERLSALGYLGGRAPEPKGALRDPKDGIALINRLERGIAEARSSPAAAARALAAVLAEDPAIPLARRYRALALSAAGDHAAAVREVETLDRAGAASFDDLLLMAESLRRLGRTPAAFAALDRAARLQPRSPEPPLARARALVAAGRGDEARAEFERVLALAQDHAEALRGLADLALGRGDLAGAARQYERVLAKDPDDAAALVKLGVLRVRVGRVDEALALFASALERDPENREALLDLGGALAKLGRPAEAVPYLERAVAAGARTTVALNSLGFARLEAGDPRGALSALRSSLALDPRQSQVAEAVRQIEGGGRP